MIVPFQLDPTAFGPYAGVAVAIYLLLDRRLRRVENQLSRLLGVMEGEKEVKR